LVQWRSNKQAAERAHESSDEIILQAAKAALTDAKTVIRSLILINGAAAISIMTFVGALAAKPSALADQISAIGTGLEWFAVGALAATLTACFAYLANSFYSWAEQKRDRDYKHPFLHANGSSRMRLHCAYVWHGLAIAATIVSLGAFVGGIWLVSGGVKAISASTPAPIPAPASK
jgi:hypothetical protein